MGRSQETPGKKDKEKKKAQKKKDKEERKQERQANSSKGKSLDDMLAYIDEYGNITSTPPDPSRRIEINHEDIEIGVAPRVEEVRDIIRQGIVTFFNESKGYGFIKDMQSQESVFLHVHQLSEPVKERDKVTFETEKGPKGLNAKNVKKVK